MRILLIMLAGWIISSRPEGGRTARRLYLSYVNEYQGESSSNQVSSIMSTSFIVLPQTTSILTRVPNSSSQYKLSSGSSKRWRSQQMNEVLLKCSTDCLVKVFENIQAGIPIESLDSYITFIKL